MPRTITLRYHAVEGDTKELSALVGALRLAGCEANAACLTGGNTLVVTIPDDIRRRLTRAAGAKRRPLPEGSPLEGLEPYQAHEWAESHTIEELAKALGISVSAAYARRKSGHIV